MVVAPEFAFAKLYKASHVPVYGIICIQASNETENFFEPTKLAFVIMLIELTTQLEIHFDSLPAQVCSLHPTYKNKKCYLLQSIYLFGC
jgi:hypothetical protein